MVLSPESPPARSDKLAQRQAAEQDVFLREVDDALREDELRTAIGRWGKPIAVAVVVILAGLAGYLFWQQNNHQSVAEQGEKFTVALDHVEAGRLPQGAQQLGTLVKGSGVGTKAAAQLMLGGVAIEQGKPAEAIKHFEAVAEDDAAPQPYRDLAAIRAIAANYDAIKPEEVIARLKPLAEPGKPWFASAGELVGLAYLKQGRNDLAGPLFAAISKDKEAPETLRARARQMAGLLGVDAIEDVVRAANSLPGQN